MSQVSGLCVCPQAGGVEGRAEPEFGAAPELYRSQSPLQLSGAGWRAASRAGAELCFREALRSGAPAFVSRCLFAGARRADFGGNRAGRPRAQAEGNPRCGGFGGTAPVAPIPSKWGGAERREPGQTGAEHGVRQGCSRERAEQSPRSRSCAAIMLVVPILSRANSADRRTPGRAETNRCFRGKGRLGAPMSRWRQPQGAEPGKQDGCVSALAIRRGAAGLRPRPSCSQLPFRLLDFGAVPACLTRFRNL